MVSAQAGVKLFQKNIPGYVPSDPTYETYVDGNGEEKKGDIPAGLSKRDIEILQNVRRSAHKLDKQFSVCGLAFGWGFIITLIPGPGDFLNLFLNYFLIVAEAKKAELPKWLEQEMFYNQAVACGCGLVPILGDIAAAIFGCNARNVALLEEYLIIRGAESLKPEGDRRYNPEDIRPGAGFPPNNPTPAPVGLDQQPQARVEV